MTERTLTMKLKVNGETRSVVVEPDDLLLDVLRNQLGLTGTKYNCRQGECGACTVIMDGLPLNSCLVLALTAEDSEITTIEGLLREGLPDEIQRAFMHGDGSQCGYCTPGMIMSTRALLDRTPRPTSEEIMEGLAGNLCRCTGYVHILESVRAAAGTTSGTTTAPDAEGSR